MTKPKWPFDMPEEFARWMASGRVTKITHHWRFTGVDTSEDWIEFHIGKESRRCPVRSWGSGGEVVFRPDHCRLVALRDDVLERVKEIEAWEKSEARDIAEYQRLTKKLFGGPTT